MFSNFLISFHFTFYNLFYNYLNFILKIHSRQSKSVRIYKNKTKGICRGYFQIPTKVICRFCFTFPTDFFRRYIERIPTNQDFWFLNTFPANRFGQKFENTDGKDAGRFLMFRRHYASEIRQKSVEKSREFSDGFIFPDEMIPTAVFVGIPSESLFPDRVLTVLSVGIR